MERIMGGDSVMGRENGVVIRSEEGQEI